MFGLAPADLAWISAAVAGLVVLVKPIFDALGLIEKALVWLTKAMAWFKSGATKAIPARTIAVIPEPRLNAFWWSLGKAGNVPLMQVVADFYVTNTTERPVHLAGALLRVNRWILFSRTERGGTLVKDMNSMYSGGYPAMPHKMTKVRADFHFPHPFGKPKKAFNSRIALIDQYGNEHWVYVRFKHVDAMFE